MSWSLESVAIIALISLVTAKWILPKFNLKTLFRFIIRQIVKPFKREWKEADKEEN